MTPKRIFDFTFSLLLIIGLSPVYLFVGLIILLFIGRPVLFAQKRPGKDEVIFTVYKFRSMSNQRDSTGELLPDHQRLGTLGKFIRSLSLDELPQLWNVLKGEMSFVGPRPLLLEYLPLYSAEQRKRHQVLPGITGWAQVNGRNATSWNDRFKFDLWYVENRSFMLDMKILFLTLQKVIKREGVSSNTSVTMEKFRGNG